VAGKKITGNGGIGMPKRTTGKRLAAAKADGRRLAERLFERPHKLGAWSAAIREATERGWSAEKLDAAIAI